MRSATHRTCVSRKFNAPPRNIRGAEKHPDDERVSGSSYSHRMRYEEAIHPVHSMHPFEAMAEPARRRIIDILASGEHTAGELAAVVGQEFRISRTAVSKHLRILRDAGFVEVRGDFQWRWYLLDVDGHRSSRRCHRRYPSEVGEQDRMGCRARLRG